MLEAYEGQEDELRELAADTTREKGRRTGAAAVLGVKFGVPLLALTQNGLAKETIKHAIMAVQTLGDPSAEAMLSGLSTPSREYAKAHAQRVEEGLARAPRERDPLDTMEGLRQARPSTASREKHRQEELARQAEEHERLRPILESAGGKLAAPVRRKAGDPAVKLHVALSEALSAVYQFPDNVELPDALRDQLDTVITECLAALKKLKTSL